MQFQNGRKGKAEPKQQKHSILQQEEKEIQSMMEKKDFITMELPNNSVGLLKQVGQREYVVNVWRLPGADVSDNEWLIENIKNTYIQYYHRVKEYTEVK